MVHRRGRRGRLDRSLAVTNAQRSGCERERRIDVRQDEEEAIISALQHASSGIPHQHTFHLKEPEPVEGGRFDHSCHSRADHVTDRHDSPPPLHCLSKSMVSERAAAEKQVNNLVQKNSLFSLGCSHTTCLTNVEMPDTGCRDYVCMKADGEACTVEKGTADSLTPSNQKECKEGDAMPSNAVIKTRGAVAHYPANDQTYTPKQDDGSDANISHQSVVENQEEKVSYCSILNQMQQQQQKRKPGRRFKRKTLMKMAKLLVIAQGWNSEVTEMSNIECSDSPPMEVELLEAKAKSGTLDSAFSSQPPSDTVNVTKSIEDRSNDCPRETERLTDSIDLSSTSQMSTSNRLKKLRKTCKRKRNASNNEKQNEEESQLSRATKRDNTTSRDFLVAAVLAQEAPLLCGSVKAPTIQRKSSRRISMTFKVDNEVKDNIVLSNNPVIANHNVPNSPNSKRKKTPKASKNRSSGAVKRVTRKKKSSETLVDHQDVTEGSKDLDDTQKKEGKLSGCDKDIAGMTESVSTITTEMPNKEYCELSSTGEVPKLKRKRGRPLKKKTLIKLAKLLRVAEERKSNNHGKMKERDFGKGQVMSSEQKDFPHPSQAPYRVHPEPIHLSAEDKMTKTIKKDEEKINNKSKSNYKQDQNRINLPSGRRSFLRRQTAKVRGKTCDCISTLSVPKPNHQPCKPHTSALRNVKKCKEKARNVPLPCQTEPLISYCDNGMRSMGDHCASSKSLLQKSHITAEPAHDPVSPPLNKRSHSKASRAQKRTSRKTKFESPITLKASNGHDSEGPDVQFRPHSHEKQAEEDTLVNNNAQIPPEGRGQGKKRKVKEKKARIAQTVSPDLGKGHEPYEVIVLCQPDSLPTQEEKKSGEIHGIINATRAKSCRKRKLPIKDRRHAERAARLTSVHVRGEEHQCSGFSDSEVHSAKANEERDNKSFEDQVEEVSSGSGSMTEMALESLSCMGGERRSKEEPRIFFTEKPQNHEDSEDNKCRQSKRGRKQISVKSIDSDEHVEGMIALFEDGVDSSFKACTRRKLTSKHQHKNMCKANEEAPVMHKVTEENKGTVDQVQNQDTIPVSVNENPSGVEISGSNETKCKKIKKKQERFGEKVGGVSKVKDKAANPEDSLVASSEDGSLLNKKAKVGGKKKSLAGRRTSKAVSTIMTNILVAGHVPSAESCQTTKTEKAKHDRKGKALVDPIDGFNEVFDNDSNPTQTSLTKLNSVYVKVKERRKCKAAKQKQSMVNSLVNELTVTDVVSNPEDNNTVSSSESWLKSQETIKDEKKKATAEKNRKNKGKMSTAEVPDLENSFTTEVKGDTPENLKAKSKDKKKTGMTMEPTASTTLAEEMKAITVKVSSSENDPPASIEVNSGVLKSSLKMEQDIQTDVSATTKRRSKRLAVREELTVTTTRFTEEAGEKQTDTTKNKKKVGRALKEKSSADVENQISSGQQKPEKDTDVLVKQNVNNTLEETKRGKKTTEVLPTSRRSCHGLKLAKTEDAGSICEAALANSSSVQDKPHSHITLLKQGQVENKMADQYFMNTSDQLAPKKPLPSSCFDSCDEIEQVEPNPLVVPITIPLAKPGRKKWRTNIIRWDTKKKTSTRAPAGALCSDTVEVISQTALEISGCSFNSSLSNSSFGKMDIFTGPQSSAVLRATQVHKMSNRDQTNKVKVRARLVHSTKSRQKLKLRKPLKCTFCGRSFRHISAFTIHQRIHTGEKPYRCKKCGKCFAQLHKLHLHLKGHKQSAAVQCPCCVSKFKKKDELIAHFKIHIKSTRKSNVTVTDDTAKDTDAGNRREGAHKSPRVTSKDGKTFQCSHCLKEFINMATFMMHQQTHGVTKPLACSFCGKTFHKTSSLSNHEKTHWPVKPYACTVCGKGFAKLKELKSHSQMHSGYMPFFCAQCDQAFSSFSSLRSHQVSKVCSDKWYRGDGNNSDIKGFLVTQTIEGQINTPMYFKCVICKQLHRYWCQYTLHLQAHSSGQPYLCDTCGQQYAQTPEISIHCIFCCKSSGEERACGSSLSEIWKEPEARCHLNSLPNDDQNICLKTEQENHVAVSSLKETVKNKTITKSHLHLPQAL